MRPSKTTADAGRDRPEIVEDLNRLMAEEAEACLRYFQMRFRLRGQDREAAEQFLEDAIKETLEHATAVATQIKAIGEVPTLRIDLSLGGGPMRLETALAEALEVEQAALDAYKDFLPRVAGDPLLEPFSRRQVEIETEHVREIREFVQQHAAVKLVAKSRSSRSGPSR